MAELFSVPINTSPVNTVLPGLQRGPDYSWLGNLPDAYWAGQNAEYVNRNRNLFQNGIPQDLGGALLRAGGAAAAPEYIRLQELGGIANLINQQRVREDAAARGGSGTSTSGYMAPATGSPGVSALPPSVGASNPAQPQPELANAPPLATADESPINIFARRAGVDSQTASAALADVGVDARTINDPQMQGRIRQVFNSLRGQPEEALPTAGPAPAPPAAGPVAGTAPAAVPPRAGGVGLAAAATQPPQYIQEMERDRDAALQEARRYRAEQGMAGAYGPAGKAAAEESAAKAAVAEERYKSLDQTLRNMKTQPMEEFNKADVAGFIAASKQADQQMKEASDGRSRIALMKQLTQQPDFVSGKLAQGSLAYQQYKQLFGKDPTAGLSPQLFQKEVNDLLQERLRNLGQSGVRVLRAEIPILQKSVASLGITPAANRAQLEIMDRVYQQRQDIGAITAHINDLVAVGQIQPGQMQATLNREITKYQKAYPLLPPEDLKDPRRLGAAEAPPDYALKTTTDAARRAWGQRAGVQKGDPIWVIDAAGNRYLGQAH